MWSGRLGVVGQQERAQIGQVIGVEEVDAGTQLLLPHGLPLRTRRIGRIPEPHPLRPFACAVATMSMSR